MQTGRANWLAPVSLREIVIAGSVYGALVFREMGQGFAGPDRGLHDVLERRDRARPPGVVRAVRVVGEVEVEAEPPVRQQLRLQVAPDLVRLAAGGGVAGVSAVAIASSLLSTPATGPESFSTLNAPGSTSMRYLGEWCSVSPVRETGRSSAGTSIVVRPLSAQALSRCR